MATTTSPTSMLNRLRNSINNAVTHIGTTNGTKRPLTEHKDNRAHIAYELAVAQLVAKRAEARYTQAKKDAISAGVMFDHKKKPLASGVVDTLYADDIVRVTVRTTSGHDRLSAGKLRDALVASGMTFEAVDKLFIAATDKTNPPHEFIADIIAPEEV